MTIQPEQVHAVEGDQGLGMIRHGDHYWELSGEIDLSNVDAFRSALETAASPGLQLRLGCSGLRFIDLAGMRVIATVARNHPGMHVVVEGAPPAFRRCWPLVAYDMGMARVKVDT